MIVKSGQNQRGPEPRKMGLTIELMFGVGVCMINHCVSERVKILVYVCGFRYV